MDSLAVALIFIFCTPYGWAGLLILGTMLLFIVEAWRGR